jgi:hypothetical protein
MLKIGLEKEFFVVNPEGRPVVVPANVAHDDCGLVAEARGNPSTSTVDAVYSLRGDIHRLSQQVVACGALVLVDTPVMKIDRATRLEASRKYTKGLTKFQNIYHYTDHRNASAEQTAGIHISFTNPTTVQREHGEITINTMFDWLSIFKTLDKAFATEIKATKRNPGFYELKGDGRIEYRSLPANVSLDKVIDVLQQITRQ